MLRNLLPAVLPALLTLTVAASAQKFQTPTGEAPGPWILGTIGVGIEPVIGRAAKAGPAPEPDRDRMAFKGLAIKLGEKGEAAVAYDLDLCRVVGAWTGGKFTTPMNLMSRGEFPSALGDVVFTTPARPGFQLSGADLQRKGGVLPSPGVATPPAGVIPPASGVPHPPGKDVPARGGVVHGRNGGDPAPSGGLHAPSGVHPAARKDAPAPSMDAPGASKDAPPGNGGGTLGTRPAGDLLWKDPRPEPYGPLPEGQARFRGFFPNGSQTILVWDIGEEQILEMPGYEMIEGVGCFTRTFSIILHEQPLVIDLGARGVGKPALAGQPKADGREPNGHSLSVPCSLHGQEGVATFAVTFNSDAVESMAIQSIHDQLSVVLPPAKFTIFCKIVLRPGSAAATTTPGIGAAPSDLDRLLKGGPARWPETVETAGELSTKTDDAYVVDTIKLPDPNPWGAPMFTSGIDFFERGTRKAEGGTGGEQRATVDNSAFRTPQSAFPADAAVCTFHGDVFLIAGLDAKLEKVRWKRFATGLYHPLGLRIVKGEIYVTCRDGIWRLHDRNGDGEADHYEAFNFDVKVTRNFHEFVFDLQTDPAGNFYFAKAGPVKNGGRGFDPIMEHHGKLLRVSPDGRKLDVVASGFRAPNGIGCGPRGELTSGDNEGTWTPACKINWITPGGFYGVVPLRDSGERKAESGKNEGRRENGDLSAIRDPLSAIPYDPPLCWLPKRVDNSGGGQVWAPEGWGPWSGKLLHLSYGQSALYGVMWETIGTRNAERGMRNEADRSAFPLPPSAFVQGGVTKFPLQFQSGIMRARFSPHDGQLYVTGLRGWQTNGLKNGCLQRVRYTGAETRMPVELHVKKDGIELRFACSLDTQSARDPEAWNVEQWRYLWSAAYGSPELSTEGETAAPGDTGRDGEAQFTKAQMSTAKHDPVTVKSVSIGTDDRSVFLEIPGLKPVMQMSIKYDLKTASGAELRGEVVNTIHRLGE